MFVMHCGDNLPILREMPDNSVDAIVTDPPYGLNDGTETLQDVFFAKFFNVFFPQFNKLIPGLLNQSQFTLPPERISLLDLMNRAIDIHSRVGVPEGSVDFNDCIVGWNEKIKDAYESPFTVPHGMLSNEIDLQLGEEAFDFTLQLRRCFNATLGDSATIGITECGFGRLGVLIVIHPQSRFASFLRSNLPSQSSSLTDIVGLLTDPARLSESASKVVTSRGTELRAILTLDSTSGTCELIPAGATCQVDAVFELVPTQNVRALTGTSGLASVFQALRVSEVKDVTARAFTLNIHRFIVPYLNKKAKGFMGQRWDYDVPSVELWAECLRVLKPGGHLLAFAGTRTQHRMAVRIEDAGFEIRDMIAWVYGSGFPKSHNVAIGIDKMNGAPARGKALVVAGRGERKDLQGKDANPRPQDLEAYAPATDAAKQWDGWGTALKPSFEPVTLARKPLAERTVAANVLTWGTGGVNVDGCRVGTAADMNARDFDDSRRSAPKFSGKFNNGQTGQYRNRSGIVPNGRFPANLIHDGSDEVVRLFPQSNGGVFPASRSDNIIYGKMSGGSGRVGPMGDTGSAARFFASFPQSKADVLDLLFCRAKAIMSAWNKDIANAAENSLHLSRHHVDSVLSDAVIVATHGGKLLSAWTGLSTGATPNELRIICEMLITAILSIENGQSLVLWQGERTPYNCLVSVAATQKQTDTMTITISLPKLDGSVESVTFNIMPALSAVGAADSAVRFKYCAKASRSEREAGLEVTQEWLDALELVWHNDTVSNLSEVLLWEEAGQNQNTDWSGAVSRAKGIFEATTAQQAGSDSHMLLNGNCATGLFLKAIRCITSTKTRLTIESKTLNSLAHLSINGNTEAVIKTAMEIGLSPAESAALKSLLKAIITSGLAVFPHGVNPAAKKTPQSINAKDALTQRLTANIHSTVKPIALMRYLCRLVTPPGGIVLDPFTGSGTTGCAAMLEGFQFIGIEREEQYVEIAQKRIEYWRQVAEHTPPSAEQAQMTLLDMQDE